MPRVTLSYRRDDSAGIARLIFERLTPRYGPGSVFMDIDAIEFGEDYRDRIHHALGETDFLLVLIGPRWLGPIGPGRNRINEANDPVRMEVERALKIGLRVIPVLLEHTPMPGPEELPETLGQLSYLNAAEISSGREFDSQIERIFRFIDRTFAEVEARRERDAEAVSTPPEAAVPIGGADIDALDKVQPSSAGSASWPNKGVAIGSAIGVIVLLCVGGVIALVHSLHSAGSVALAPTAQPRATAMMRAAVIPPRVAASPASKAPPSSQRTSAPTSRPTTPPKLAPAPVAKPRHTAKPVPRIATYPVRTATFLSAWAIEARGRGARSSWTAQARDTIEIKGCTARINQSGALVEKRIAQTPWLIPNVAFDLSQLRIGELTEANYNPPFYQAALSAGRSGATYWLALPQSSGPTLYGRLNEALARCQGAPTGATGARPAPATESTPELPATNVF